ncbi:uncharacterized protein PHACADRAFT_188437 [Phanerochaete carnosa HHB-10118-sp]|uniref:Fungal-type protein kinase domain-containing protein n=1 Tax=Phanerochaete carnosa (strain HHB-10118-sp) TaxID=650164 RepID=K5WIK5_PHACS|nr:uncharacterized protein PHACADRAFT_188437 [Phanerochaete carnosa HHB-10118-sp]EKM50077.1 hypothetical protein PHACADRAFT_188437 [Phanerochaete carnosa HHB-10118-sp]
MRGSLELTLGRGPWWVYKANEDMANFYLEIPGFLWWVFRAELVDEFERVVIKSKNLNDPRLTLAKAKIKKGEEMATCGTVAGTVNTMFCKLELPFFLAVTCATSESNREPNLILYHTRIPGKPDPTAPYYLEQKKRDRNSKHYGRTIWASAVAIVKVNTDSKLAPFNFDDKPFAVTTGNFELHSLSWEPDSRDSCVQMISYVTEIHVCQHHCFLFTTFIQEQFVCFMRWDCSGAIILELHDWMKNLGALLEPFWCLAQSTDEQLGYNSTATLVSTGSTSNFTPISMLTLKRKLTELKMRHHSNKWLTKYIDDAAQDDRKYPWVRVSASASSNMTQINASLLCQIMCQDINNPTHLHAYYIARHCAGSRHSACGCGTKNYIGLGFDFESDKMQVVFIKDFWYSEGMRPELENYALLREHRVSNIPSMLAGGNVRGMEGETSQMAGNQEFFSNNLTRPSKHIHCCIIMKEIGCHLETYMDQVELLRCTHDTFEAHKLAYERAKLLHHDTSAENIVINVVTGKGLLIDWGYAKVVNGSTDSTTLDRSGTWIYMSGPLLMCPLKPNHLFDDLESFVHVLEVFGMRFHLHSASSTSVFRSEDGEECKIFDAAANSENSDFTYTVQSHYYLVRKQDGYFVGGPLPTLISDWYWMLSQHYRTLDECSWKAVWGGWKIELPVSQDKQNSVNSCMLFQLTHEDLDSPWRAVLSNKALLNSAKPKTGDQFEHLPSVDGFVFVVAATGSKTNDEYSSVPDAI